MDKAALTTLREALEHARQQLDYVIGRLTAGEDPRYLRWRCRRCDYVKAFTRPMPEHVAPPCLKCLGTEFEAVPWRVSNPKFASDLSLAALASYISTVALTQVWPLSWSADRRPGSAAIEHFLKLRFGIASSPEFDNLLQAVTIARRRSRSFFPLSSAHSEILAWLERVCRGDPNSSQARTR